MTTQDTPIQTADDRFFQIADGLLDQARINGTETVEELLGDDLRAGVEDYADYMFEHAPEPTRIVIMSSEADAIINCCRDWLKYDGDTAQNDYYYTVERPMLALGAR